MSEEEKNKTDENEEEKKGNPEELVEKLKEKDEELEAVKKELKGLKDKDFNFKKLRDMTEEETAKLSEKEMELIKRQEKLEEEQQSWSETLVNSHKNDALSVFAGDDESLRKSILFHYDRIKDEAKTKDEIVNKMRDAYHIAIAGKKSGGVDPIARAMSSYSGSGVVKTSNKWTDDQKDLASRMGISEEEIKKFSK